MEGLFGPNGGKRLLKSYNGLYLTEDMAHRRAITRGWRTWRTVETHYWTIEKINEKEVFFRFLIFIKIFFTGCSEIKQWKVREPRLFRRSHA